MAIWIDDIKAEAANEWRGTDIAMIASLGMIMLMQIAVVFYIFDFGATSTAANDVPRWQMPADASPQAADGATRFAATPASPGLNGSAANSGFTFWFTPGSAVANVEFANAAKPLVAPDTFTFAAGGMVVGFAEVPLDYRDTMPVAPAIAPSAQTAVAVFSPQIKVPATTTRQRLANLRDYFDPEILQARCGEALKQAYKYDGGMIELCQDLRTTL